MCSCVNAMAISEMKISGTNIASYTNLNSLGVQVKYFLVLKIFLDVKKFQAFLELMQNLFKPFGFF